MFLASKIFKDLVGGVAYGRWEEQTSVTTRETTCSVATDRMQNKTAFLLGKKKAETSVALLVD